MPKTELNEAGLESLSEEERKVWRLLVARYKKASIRPSDFSNYDRESIRKDEEYVASIEEKFRLENNPEKAASLRRGELLEALIDEAIKKARWMGPDTTTINTSRYDDIRNGIDMILELIGREGFSHLALSIDMTSSSKQAAIKLGNIKNNILGGNLPDIKYFHSQRAGIKGGYEKIPKLIIGVDPDSIRDLCLTRLEIHTFHSGLKNPKNNSESLQRSLRDKKNASLEKFAKSIVRFIIIREMEMQLIKYEQFARKNNKIEVAEKYRSAYETLQRIKGPETESLDHDTEEQIEKDEVFQSIKLALKDFN